MKYSDLIDLPKETIDDVFSGSKTQSDYWKGLFKIAFPEQFDRIQMIEDFPRVSKNTNQYLFQKAIEFDEEHHPGVLGGGLWMDRGFGTNFLLKEDWKIDMSKVLVVMKNDT